MIRTQACRRLVAVWLAVSIWVGYHDVHGETITTFSYNPSDGGLSFTSTDVLTTIEMKSVNNFFTGIRPELMQPPFDVYTPGKFFVLKTNGIPDTDFGPVLTSGLSHEQLAADLCVEGSVLPRGGLETVGLLNSSGELLPFTGCQVTPVETRIRYDASSGNMSFASTRRLSTLEMNSTQGVFTGTAPDLLEPPFDLFTPDSFFIVRTNGLSDADFGPIAKPGLSHEQLAADLCVRGSVLPSGDLGTLGLESASGAELIPFSGCPAPPPPPPTEQYFLTYDQATGHMAFEYDGQSAPEVTTLLLDSRSGIFTGPQPESLDNPFDVVRPDRVFHLDAEGFTQLDLGKVAQVGLAPNVLRTDLCISGSLLEGGGLPRVGLFNPSGRPISACTVTPPTTGGAQPPRPDGVGGVRLFYDESTGNLSIDGGGSLVTTLEIVASEPIFVGPTPNLITPPFDVYEPTKLFVLKTDGLDAADFGAILPAGLTTDFLESVLSIEGSILPQGGLGPVTIIRSNLIPEPSGCWMAISGLLVLGSRKTGWRTVYPVT